MARELKINREIRAPKVRLIDSDGTQLGILDKEDALKIAIDRELDLIEISPQADPPVCRVIDYGKFKFDQKKRSRKAQQRQKKIHLKEIKMRPKISQHDYDFKLNHIETFLSNGDKVKISIQFRGREIAHVDRGYEIMKRLYDALKNKVIVEREAKLEGRQMIMIVAPAK